MLGQHLCLRARAPIALDDTIARRRLIARTVLRLGREAQLAAFGLEDRQLRLIAFSARDVAAEFARRVELSLGGALRLAAGFYPAYIEPVTHGRHAYRLFDFILQASPLQLRDPRREGSALPDLLGLRPLGGYLAQNVRRFLPRIHREDLLRLFDLPRLEPSEGPVDQVIPAGLAATALPALDGASREVNALRRAMLPLLQSIAPSRQAELLGVHRASVFRWRQLPHDTRLLGACRLQLGLYQQLLRRHGLTCADVA